MPGLTTIAEWASIIGTLISIGTLIVSLILRSKIKKLQNEHYSIVRLPKIWRDLNNCKAKIFDLRMGDISDISITETMRYEIERSITILKMLEKHLPDMKSDISKTKRLVRTFYGSPQYPSDRNGIHLYYLAIDRIANSISYYIEDQRKGIKND